MKEALRVFSTVFCVCDGSGAEDDASKSGQRQKEMVVLVSAGQRQGEESRSLLTRHPESHPEEMLVTRVRGLCVAHPCDWFSDRVSTEKGPPADS